MKKQYGIISAFLLALVACGGGGSSGSADNLANLLENAGPITSEGEAVAKGVLNTMNEGSDGITGATEIKSLGSSSSLNLRNQLFLSPALSTKSILNKETFSECGGRLVVNVNESAERITFTFNDFDLNECFLAEEDGDLLVGAIFNGKLTIDGGDPITADGDITVNYNDTPVEILIDGVSKNALLNGEESSSIEGSIDIDGEEIGEIDYHYNFSGDVNLSGEVNADVVYNIHLMSSGDDLESLSNECSGQMVITRSGGTAELCNVNADCSSCL